MKQNSPTNLFRRIALVIVALVGLVSIIGSGGIQQISSYKDSTQDFRAERNRQGKTLDPPIMFLSDYNKNISFQSCDTSQLANITSSIPFYQLHPHWNVALFDQYSYNALSESYSDKKETNQYVKLRRIIVEEKQSANNMSENFIRLQKKWLLAVNEVGGDAVIDMCFYFTDYNCDKIMYSNNPYISQCSFNFTSTGTVIKFKDDFFPDQKFLIKNAQKNLSTTKE